MKGKFTRGTRDKETERNTHYEGTTGKTIMITTSPVTEDQDSRAHDLTN